MKFSHSTNISPLQTSSSFYYTLSTISSKKRLLNNYSSQFHIFKTYQKLRNFHKTILHEKFVKSYDSNFSSLKLIKNKNDDFSKLNYKKNTKGKKLNYEIRSLLSKENYKDNYSFTQTCNKISKIKKLIYSKEQNYKLRRREFNMRKKEIENSYNFSKNRLKKIENKILPKYKNYLSFLYKKLNEELEKYYELQNKKNELLIAIYKIKAKIRKVKNKKNQYIDMRNFLIKVKENLLTLPKNFIQSSYDFDNNIYNLNEKISLPKNKKRNSIINVSYSNKRKSISINRNIIHRKSCFLPSHFIINTSEYDKYLKKSELIFENEDEFKNYFSNIEIKNVNLVKQLNILRNEIFELKNQLKEIEKQYEDYNNLFIDDLKKKEFVLLDCKLKYESLKKKIDELKSDNSIRLKNNKKEINSLLGPNILNLRFEKIKKKMNFKKKGSYIFYYLYLIFNNLYRSLPNFFKDIGESKIKEFTEILSHPDNYYEKIKFNLGKQIFLFVEKIYSIVQMSIIQAKKNLKEENLKKIIKNTQKIRRINNAREQRILMNEKKTENLNKILERKHRFPFKIKRKHLNLFNINKNKKPNHKKTISLDYELKEIFSD